MILVSAHARELPMSMLSKIRRHWLPSLALVLVVGCGRQADEEGPANAGDGPPLDVRLDQPPTEEQKATMIAAKDALFEKLSGRLMEVMSSDGPVAAIAVCKSEASAIAEAVGQQQGVRIGRTALKRRNPQNTPPAWAASLLAESRDEPTLVTFGDGRAAALLPIKLKAQCLMCHGPTDQIMPEIKAQLAKHYPRDEATGFQEGDLRGWFWVETLK
jgi:hypothetical protein